jgi:3-hydroxyisobutyrate dehydrogenase-like beta-hydroxyacid dehydrogenase
MVGGEDDAVAQVWPVLGRLGRASFHLGPVGTGTTMKLVNSLVAFASTWSSLEGLSLAAAEGIDLRTAVEVVRTGGASNFFIDRVVDGIDVRDRDVQFALALAAKDARLMGELAAAHDIGAPVATALAEVLGDAVDRGLGERDWSDLVVAAEARAGRSLLLGPPPADHRGAR